MGQRAMCLLRGQALERTGMVLPTIGTEEGLGVRTDRFQGVQVMPMPNVSIVFLVKAFDMCIAFGVIEEGEYWLSTDTQTQPHDFAQDIRVCQEKCVFSPPRSRQAYGPRSG
jgi:hypothetical protein